MISTRRIAIIAVAALLGVAGAFRTRPARADYVYFAKGGRAQLPVRREAEKISVDAPGGVLEFLEADFLKIVPDEVANSVGSEPGQRFADAWKSLENGRTSGAVKQLRAVHAIEPKHEPTATLIQTLDRIGRPLDDPETSRVLRVLGTPFREARSAHFLLFHKGSEAKAQQRLALLEDIYTSFYLIFVGQGLKLNVPDRRMMTAVFASQQDYLEFLRRGDARGFASSQGYYHPILRIVVAFDPADLPKIRIARGDLERRRRQLEETSLAVDRMPTNARLNIEIDGETPKSQSRIPAKSSIEALRRDLLRQQLLLELDLQSIESGMAAHEAVHQLVAVSGLAPHHDDFPTWLHEGLAAQFEVIRSGRWAGVSRANDIRLPEWRAISPSPRLVPLIRDQGFGHGYDRDLYAKAWSMVYFLRKSHPKEFTNFLDALRSPAIPSGSRSDRVVAAFRENFGDDLFPLEEEWHHFMRSVTTPLEDAAPSKPIPR